ncbi:MAG: biotin transporter BioY [Flavobacteriales bacterium]
MFDQELQFTKDTFLDLVIKVLISVGPMCLLGPHQLGVIDGIPITTQTVLVLLPALIFGWRVGLTSVLAYLLLGGIGLPVFAQQSSGWGKFTGITGGFLFAFAIAALVVGYLAERIKLAPGIKSFLLLTLGHLIILVLGFTWKIGVSHSGDSLFDSLKHAANPSFVKIAIGTIFMIVLARIIARMSNKPA